MMYINLIIFHVYVVLFIISIYVRPNSLATGTILVCKKMVQDVFKQS
jgi:hypothetical protein